MSRRSLGVFLVVALGGALLFAELLREVAGHTGLTVTLDPWLARAIAIHRVGWLAVLFSILTWLGSAVFLIPLGLAVIAWLWLRRHTLRVAILLAVAIGGAAGLYDIAKPLVRRLRPEAALQYGGPDEGWAFPSGHATQSASFYAMLVVVLSAYAWPRRRVPLALAAAAIVLVIAASRLYLGVHWLTDVVAGLGLGLTWFAIVMAVAELIERRRSAKAGGSSAPAGRSLDRRSGRTAPG
jgi:membrane-associated phospholipid phosphatase